MTRPIPKSRRSPATHEPTANASAQPQDVKTVLDNLLTSQQQMMQDMVLPLATTMVSLLALAFPPRDVAPSVSAIHVRGGRFPRQWPSASSLGPVPSGSGSTMHHR